uniref:Uncharacterized protein n=1 Tax=Schlesneria paludicola TaxID=360056 RepID=A0A7C2PI04_9PLAN
MAIHIPEMRIALPTVEFPSPIKFRREAEMIFDQIRGPLSAAPVQEFGNLPEQPNVAPPYVPQPAPPSAPCVPPACTAPAGCTVGDVNPQLEATLARLERMEQELAALRAQNQALSQQRGSQTAAHNLQGAGKATTVTTRPLPPRRFMQAAYQEPAAASAPAAPPPSAPIKSPVRKPVEPARFGLSAPSDQSAEDGFGTWTTRPQ